MKRNKYLISFLVLVCILLSTSVAYSKILANPTSPFATNESTINITADSTNLENSSEPNPNLNEIKNGYGMDLKTVEDSNNLKSTSGSSSFISMDDAIKNAYEKFGAAFNAQSNKGKAKQYMLTDKVGNSNKPVWLVTFDGLKDAGRNGNKTEVNVYVDAQTGEALYAFLYR